MGFDITTLDELANAIGAEVPNGDPDAIFDLANQLEASAQAWDGHAGELARLKAQLRSALAGDTAEAHDRQLAKLLNGPDSLQGDSAAVRAGVAALRNYAADLQDNQWTSRLLAAWLLATMIWGAASVIATGGESLVEVAVARVRTAAAVNALKEMLWRRIATILTELLVNAGRGALLAGAEQLVVQGFQVATGQRTGLNEQLIAGTGLSFAEFGVGAEAVEHGVVGLVGDAVNDSRAGSVAAWATSKVLSGIGGNTVATAAAGGPITPDTVLAGAAMGAAGGLADARGKGTTATTGAASVHEPTENVVPANAIDTHPTLRFEKQLNGTFAWPGETTHDAGPHAHTASAPAPTTEPATTAGEHSAGAPAYALRAAADPARSVEATTTTPPAAADTGHLPATRVAAGLDPPPAAHASLGAHLEEGTLDPSITSPAAHTGPLTATASPAVSPAPTTSNVASPATPAAQTAPTAAGPPPAPPASPAGHGPNAGLSSPTPDPQPGPAEDSPAVKSSAEPAGARAAGRFDTTTTAAVHTEPGAHDTPAEQAAHAASVDHAAQAERPAVGSHLVGRQDSAAADRQQRPAHPRHDPSTRPNGTRHDPSTRPGTRPGTLRRNGPVADPVPAAAPHDPYPLAAHEQIGAIKAHHDDNGPGPKPESQQDGGDGRDGHNSTDIHGPGSTRAETPSNNSTTDARAQRAYRAEDPTVHRTDPSYADPLMRWRVVRLPGQPEPEVFWESANWEFEGALNDAARAAIESSGGRALNRRVGLVGGEHPRGVIVNWEGSDHDAELTAALDQFPESAAALTQPDAQIQYLAARVDPHDNIQLCEIDSPEVQSATIESGRWQGTQVTYWRDTDGYWRPVPRDVPLDRIPPACTGSDLTASHPLREEYHGENDPNLMPMDRVHYFSAAELEATRVFVGPDGRLYRAADGTPFHAPDWALFVMDRGGNLYALDSATSEIPSRLHHSSFFAGAPVAAAGRIKSVYGRMLAMHDQNGHYWATANANDRGLQLLCKRGLILADGFLRYDHHTAVRESTLTHSNEQSPGHHQRDEITAVAPDTARGGTVAGTAAISAGRAATVATADGRHIRDPGAADRDDFARAQQDPRAHDAPVRTAAAVSELPGIAEIHGDQARLPRQRILVFIDRWARNNGVEVANMAMCRALADAGHEVYVRVKRPPEVEVPDGVTVIGPRHGKLMKSRYEDVSAFLADLPESVDIVIGNGHDGGMAAVHAAEHRYPDAKCVHRISRFPMQSDPIGRTPIHARAQLAADIYTARHSDLVSGPGPMLAAEALVSSSMAGRASIHALRPGLTMAEQPPLPLSDAPKRVLLFGRTDDPSKGAAVTADVVRELRNRGHDTAQLVVLGADPRTVRQVRDTLAATVGHPDAVEVLPRTSNPEELQAIIRSATVVIMPSRVEPFGWVAMEAIEQGVPAMMPSSSGAGQFLADLPGYREAAKEFNLVKQPLYAPPSVDAWTDRLDVVLRNLPQAWANARQLQKRLASFTPESSAEHLVRAALNAPRRPPLPGRPSRARVRVVGWGVVVDPYGDEAGDHDLILAVADAMETDPEVKAAIAGNAPVNFGPVQFA